MEPDLLATMPDLLVTLPDLPGILTDALALLAEGAADPGSAWRNVALGSVGLDGAPQVRTVVLRRFGATERTLDVHTDIRSAKYGELLARPAATLHGWDTGRQVQLRASGLARLHTRDAVARAAWAELRPASRETYRVQPGPGTRIDMPGTRDANLDESSSFDVFCVVRLRIDALEWLHLARASHRRARFTWAGDTFAGTWLVP